MKRKHKLALFLVYFLLFVTIAAMIDYYAYDEISPWIFITISFLGATGAVVTHAKSHQKSKADELAKDIEKIL